MSTTILVTGGGGRLANALRETGDPRIVTPLRASFDIAEAANVAAGLDQVAPAVVINAGGFTKVDLAESQQAQAIRDNVRGAQIIAEACAARGIPLIHISTDLVFGDGGPWREDDAPAPMGVYGRTKLDGERAVSAAGGVHVIARIAWLFGQQGDFLNMMLDIASKKDAVAAPVDQTSSPTPSNLLAEHLLDLSDLLAARQTLPRVLHLAGAPEATRYEWVRETFEGARAAGANLAKLSPGQAIDFPAPARRPGNSALNTDLATSLFGKAMDWRKEAAEVGARWARSKTL